METFVVSIVNVTLADGNLGQDSLSPRALPGAEDVQIQIGENDNARGILNFNVDLVRTDAQIFLTGDDVVYVCRILRAQLECRKMLELFH